MLRQWILIAFSLVLFPFAVMGAGQSPKIVEGEHYIVLSKSIQQQSVVQAFLEQDKGKIQVAEFFSYKCPGCYSLEGIFSAWEKRQPSDVAIRRVPVAFGPTWEPLAKTYYVLEEKNAVERLNPVIFNAIHKDGKRLETQAEIAALLAEYDMPSNEFNAAYEGFNVTLLWTQAQLLRQAENVTSIPAVVVNGQYLTHLGMTQDPIMFTQVIDYLIAKSRDNK